MHKWQYKRCTVIGIEADSDRLAEMSKLAKEAVMFKELGEQGWELVSVSNSIAYFKKPY
tara:strand:- start:266 stop:442 length:177 start_codon:yes stop_codon:yes gene_type:complete